MQSKELSKLFGGEIVSYHSALNRHTRPRLPIPNEPEIPPCQPDELLFLITHQLVQAGSLSAAYQRLTEPDLCQIDPLPCFLEIPRDIDLSDLNLHPNSVQAICDTT